MSDLERQFRTGLAAGQLTLKLACDESEIRACQRLRFEVFHNELGEGLPENEALGLDVDSFDEQCDHIMVMSKDQVIGTYRVLWGPHASQGFYSETEFQLRPMIDYLKARPEQLVELGRGCIHPEHRKQSTLLTLFFGLKKYLEAKNARYLFGCGSLPPGTNANDTEKSHNDLKGQGLILEIEGVGPLHPENNFSGNPSLGKNAIPDLLAFYFRFGAKCVGRPTYDPVFKCFDFLVLFDFDHLSDWGIDLVDRFSERLKRKNDEKPQ